MEWADAFVLVLPCGRSAHLELGRAAGAGKPAFVLLEGDLKPELMCLLATRRALCLTLEEVIERLASDAARDQVALGRWLEA